MKVALCLRIVVGRNWKVLVGIATRVENFGVAVELDRVGLSTEIARTNGNYKCGCLPCVLTSYMY